MPDQQVLLLKFLFENLPDLLHLGANHHPAVWSITVALIIVQMIILAS
jgi:hypothetical protein